MAKTCDTAFYGRAEQLKAFLAPRNLATMMGTSSFRSKLADEARDDVAYALRRAAVGECSGARRALAIAIRRVRQFKKAHKKALRKHYR
jgi:hypothetical protein